MSDANMRLVCEALGFDPTNHHNAAKCPYCTPDAEIAALRAELAKVEGERDTANEAREAHAKCAAALIAGAEAYAEAAEARALALEARVEEMGKALEPFAKAAELFEQPWNSGLDALIYGPAAGSEYNITSAHLRRARAALRPKEQT